MGNGSELLRYFGIQILLHYALVLISMAIAVVLNSNVFSMTIVICLCMNTMIVLYGVINHLIQKAGVENFQILKYTVTGKIALLSMSPTNKECLTAVVIAAAFGIVVTLLTAWVFRKRYLNDKTRVRAIDSSDTGTRNVILEIPAAGERHLPPVVVSDEARQQHADYQRNGFWRHW